MPPAGAPHSSSASDALSASIDALANAAADQLQSLVRRSRRFQDACDQVFDELDRRGDGRVASDDALAAGAAFFDALAHALAPYGVQLPPPPELRPLLASAVHDARGSGGGGSGASNTTTTTTTSWWPFGQAASSGGQRQRQQHPRAPPTLTRAEFEAFYLALLRAAAGGAACGAARKYGAAAAAGVVALFVAKRAVRAVPVVGLVSSPLLALVPTLLVGPALGVLGAYCADHGGLDALKELWEGATGGGGGGFISG